MVKSSSQEALKKHVLRVSCACRHLLMHLSKIKENELAGSSNVTAHCAAMQTLHIRPTKKHFSGAIRVR